MADGAAQTPLQWTSARPAPEDRRLRRNPQAAPAGRSLGTAVVPGGCLFQQLVGSLSFWEHRESCSWVRCPAWSRVCSLRGSEATTARASFAEFILFSSESPRWFSALPSHVTQPVTVTCSPAAVFNLCSLTRLPFAVICLLLSTPFLLPISSHCESISWSIQSS